MFLLLTFLLRMPWINNDWLFDRCREVQASPDGHLDLWARGHAKTNIITIGLTVQDILNDPEITVSIFSHVRSISKDILSKIKREFEDNAQLKYVYSDVLWAEPKREAPRWSEDNGLIVKRLANPKEGTLEAHGLVDGMPTGKHFDLRIYDDVVTQASCTTSDQIQKTTDAWDLSQNLGISGGGKVRYIGTRYNLGDSYATMIERGAVVPRIYPATHDGRMTGRPVFLSDEAWANTLRNSSRSIIASQQLQNPLADEDASFSPEWLRAFNVRPRHLNIYVVCDPSAGRSASSDNTAIAVIGMGSTGHLYLLGGCCHRMPLSARWTALSGLYHRWSRMAGVQHIAVGYERYGMQTDLEYFEERMEFEKRKGLADSHFTISELSWTRDGTRSKRERVERLEPFFRNGRFLLPQAVMRDGKDMWWEVQADHAAKNFGEIIYSPSRGLTNRQMDAIKGGSADLLQKALTVRDPGLPGPRSTGGLYDLTLRLIDEYRNFPFGRHDDLLDACSRVIDLDPRPPMAPSARRSEDPKVYRDGI